MVFVLGMACVAWTVIELLRLARSTPSLLRTPSSPPRSASGARRLPLAAWDAEGRPIFVEDVTHRGPR
jgi:hypothetical protein